MMKICERNRDARRYSDDNHQQSANADAGRNRRTGEDFLSKSWPLLNV